MNAHTIKIECDEDGFYILIDGTSMDPEYQAGEYRWKIEDPEALYDHVKAAIGPWLEERDAAFAEFRAHAAAGVFRCNPDESGGVVVAIREDGSYRVESEDADPYDPTDPKHPRYHSTHADLHDLRGDR